MRPTSTCGCQHLLKGRLYSHSTVKTTLSQQNFQHLKPTDAANKYLWLPASSEGKIVLTQYSLNNALPAELSTLQTNRCGQQDDTVFTQYDLNNALPAELPTLQTNRCDQQEPMLSASTTIHTVRSKQCSPS